jgi:hypothetical protein
VVLNCTLAGSARILILRAGSNAPSPSPSGSRVRTSAINVRFIPCGFGWKRKRLRRVRRGRWMPGRHSRIYSRNSPCGADTLVRVLLINLTHKMLPVGLCRRNLTNPRISNERRAGEDAQRSFKDSRSVRATPDLGLLSWPQQNFTDKRLRSLRHQHRHYVRYIFRAQHLCRILPCVWTQFGVY